MQVHPITLAFRESDHKLESRFKEAYFHNTLRQSRFALGVALIFVCSFSLFDAVVVPDLKHLFWAIRWLIICPTALATILFSYTRFAPRHMQLMLCLCAIIAGFSLSAMMLMAPPDKQYAYLGGLVPILFSVCTFLRIRFIWSAISLTLILIFYAVWGLLGTYLPYKETFLIISYLFGNNILGLAVCYSMEYHTRNTFFLSRQLETQKRRLDMTNRFLERRVEKRTADIANTNHRLEAEIKERKIIENALRESKIRYGRMINNVTDYMCVHDMKGKILEVNYPMISGLEYSQAEIIGFNIKELMTQESQKYFDRYMTRLNKGKKATGNVTFVAKSGRHVFMEYSSVMAQHMNSGDVVYCLARDITERRRTELALAESQARFKNIFDISAAGMMIVNCDNQEVIEINPAAAQIIGDTTDNIVGKKFKHFINVDIEGNPDAPSGDIDDPVECDLILKSNRSIPILKTMRRTEFEGQPYWLVSFVSLEKVKEAETAKREAEIQLNRAQHLQSIGTLAGGIAHDFNNILYGVIGYTQLALDDAPVGSQLFENIEEILQGSQRAQELVTQILTFSRQDDTERKPITPAPLIKEALKLLRASTPATIEMKSNISPDAQTIMANPTQIHQVMMNLCTNATHAMLPQGGLLSVTLDNVTIETEELALPGPLKPGFYVRLLICDNGAGMPKNVQNRIFEPFYTTKPQGGGTGMGLSVVLGVVQSHNGNIRVKSELGKGSQFEIFLPVAAETSEDENSPQLPTPKGSERILFVDDEMPLIRMGQQMLTKLGYQVTTCHDPIEALEMFRNEPDQFDLVITDLTMPKLSGTKMARHMLHLKPDLPVIMCTGYGDEITEEQIEEIGIRELMLKPILRSTLAVKIRQALDVN